MTDLFECVGENNFANLLPLSVAYILSIRANDPFSLAMLIRRQIFPVYPRYG